MTASDVRAQMDISGNSVGVAEGRLVWVASMVDRRIDALLEARERGLKPPKWQHEPAFEVHVYGTLRALLSDDTCRGLLQFVVTEGVRSHVVVFLHGVPEQVAEVLASLSTRLAEALRVGRSLRIAP